MKKLTAEKCRNKIEECKYYHKAGVVTAESEILLQAIEIALPILEQQEQGEWIEWSGGECPVPPKTIVTVRYRKGKEESPGEAGGYFWSHGSGIRATVDIIAYRIIPERATNQNGEQ